MEIQKHFLMTFAALFFLALIVVKPGSIFYPSQDQTERECKMAKGKIDCQIKSKEYRSDYTIYYVLQK